MTAEAIFGLVGGVITSIYYDLFWQIVFWSTLIVSGTILLLNLLNAYQPLRTKASFLGTMEFGYVVLWALLYLIGTIISFIPKFWMVGAVIGYIEGVLFLLDGVLHFRVYRGGGGS